MVDDQRHRPRGHGVAGEVVPVDPRAAHTAEQRAVGDGARVVDDRADLGVTIGPGDPDVHSLGGGREVGQAHAYPPGAPGLGAAPGGGTVVTGVPVAGSSGRPVAGSTRARSRRHRGGRDRRRGGSRCRPHPAVTGVDGQRRGRRCQAGGDAHGAGGVPADLGERGCRDRGGVRRRGRLVDDHDDRQLRVAGRQEPGERRDVVVVAVRVLVAAAFLGLARRAGLAGGVVAVDGGGGSGAVVDHFGQHGTHLRGGRRRDHAPRVARRGVLALALGVAGGLDQRRSDVDAVVGHDVVGEQHLHGRDRHALAERDRADRRARPVRDRRHVAVLLVGQPQAGVAPEAEPTQVLVEALLAELLGDHDRADVRRLGEDVGHRQRAGVRCRCTCLSATWCDGRHVEHLLGRHQALLEGGRQRDDLVDRARLVVGGDGEVVAAVGHGAGRRVGLLVGHRQDLAGLGVGHDHDAALGADGRDLPSARMRSTSYWSPRSMVRIRSSPGRAGSTW